MEKKLKLELLCHRVASLYPLDGDRPWTFPSKKVGHDLSALFIERHVELFLKLEWSVYDENATMDGGTICGGDGER